MTNTVYFNPVVGGDGSTITDDSNATTGLANGGHRTRFVPCLSNTVAVAQTAVNAATAAAASAAEAAPAAGSASAAAASAASAATARDAAIAAWTAANSPAETLAAVSQSLHSGSVVKLFVYDTLTDSDGGIWRKSCQGKSWYQESIVSGPWLGQATNEFSARNLAITTTGSELLSNGSFSSDSAAWVDYLNGSTGGTVVISGGELVITQGSNSVSMGATQAITTVAGQTYRVTATRTSGSYGRIHVGTTAGGSDIALVSETFLAVGTGVKSITFVATGTTTYVTLIDANSAGQVGKWANASVKAVAGDGLYDNLIPAGEALDGSPWQYSNVTVTANTTTAPDGTSTADKVIEAAGSNRHEIYTGASSVIASGSKQTYSIYAKAGGRSYMTIAFNGNSAQGATFDLSGGAITATGASATAAIQSVGNGWYRCSVTFTPGSTGTMYHMLRTNGTGTSVETYVGDGSSGVFMWGAKLHFGSTATPYTSATASLLPFFQNSTDGLFYSLSAGSGTTQVYRGNTREFPAQAAIIVEASRVVIYDLTVIGAPMWMVFIDSTTAGVIGWTTNGSISDISCAVAVNGGLFIGCGTHSGVEVNFIKDDMRLIFSSAYSLTSSRKVSARNGVTAYAAGGDGYAVINATINDIAATVLKDAPTDAATSLPVPTIAVGTAGGCSVIKHDGTVSTAENGDPISSVSFDPIGRLVMARGSSGTNTVYVSTDYLDANKWTYSPSTIPALLPLVAGQYGKAIHTRRATFATGFSSGLQLIAENPATQAKGMVAYATKDYNTGWMLGDIRGCWLSDTTVETITGSGELITNGTFTTDTSGWTAGSSAVLSVDTNRLKVTNGAAANGYAYQAITTTAGKTYRVSVDFNRGGSTTTAYLYAGTSAGGNQLGSTNSASATGTLTFDFVATGVTSYITVLIDATNTNFGYYDNITVKLVSPDRSVKNHGLQVNGSLTKAAVASGAQLVGFSGWSASNYLEQPYNTDLDFGTGDCLIFMSWLYVPSLGSATIMHRSLSGSGGGIEIETNGSGLVTIYGSASTSYTNLLQSSSGITAGQWCFLEVLRSSGTLYIRINGVQVGSVANSTNLTYASTVTRLGLLNTGGTAFNGTMALVRIGGTPPSAEQSAQIYRDELSLFQANAQATLAGTSNAVLGLDYNKTTKLLNVITSYGRSSFDGLTRVSSEATTYGTPTAIASGQEVVLQGGTSAIGSEALIRFRDQLNLSKLRNSLGKIAYYDAAPLIKSSRTGNTQLLNTDWGKLIDITSGTFTQTFDTANFESGWWCRIRNSGTGDITIGSSDGVSNWPMMTGEVRDFSWDGTVLTSTIIKPFFKTFTSSGTFTKPPGYTCFEGLMWSGGASGQKSGGATLSLGGGGGGCAPFYLLASAVGTTETVTIGAGGAAVSGTANGNKGGDTSFGSLFSVNSSAVANWYYGGSVNSMNSAFTSNQLPAVGFEGGAISSGITDGGRNATWGGGASTSGASAITCGTSIYGGGAGASIAAGGTIYTAGTSKIGGNGGTGSSASSGTDGVAPAGGGGATQTGAASGAGARGEIRIWGIT